MAEAGAYRETGDTAEAAVAFRTVDVVFGDRPERALPLIDAGKTREQILASTGLVLGVAGASLAVGRGEICVLMGLSGSGKSTLLRTVNRLNRATRGEVRVATPRGTVDVARCAGAELRRLRTEHVAMVFQGFGLLPWRTVAANVGLGLELKGVGASERERIVKEKLELVHLGAWADKRVHELSGGMQQRVGLARALATDAAVLLMDEPFSALDPLIRGHLQDELLGLQAKLGTTVVFVSHDLEEALKLGTTIAVMQDGRIVQAGPPEAIVTRPATDYVRAFVAQVNPLSVLTFASASRSLEGRGDGDGRVIVDERTALVARLDRGGRLSALEGPSGTLEPVGRLEAIDGTRSPCDQILVARPGEPLRLAVDAIRLSGWPVLLVDDEERLLGAVGVEELLAALARRPGAER